MAKILTLEERIARQLEIEQKAREKLKKLVAKRDGVKPPRPKKAPTGKPRGNQPIDPEKIAAAKTLAKEAPIKDVAASLGVARSTLYENGVKRYLIPFTGKT